MTLIKLLRYSHVTVLVYEVVNPLDNCNFPITYRKVFKNTQHAKLNAERMNAKTNLAWSVVQNESISMYSILNKNNHKAQLINAKQLFILITAYQLDNTLYETRYIKELFCYYALFTLLYLPFVRKHFLLLFYKLALSWHGQLRHSREITSV